MRKPSLSLLLAVLSSSFRLALTACRGAVARRNPGSPAKRPCDPTVQPSLVPPHRLRNGTDNSASRKCVTS